MSHLLNSVAAAAGSMLRRNSPDPLDIILKPSVWLYRNLCWYGMQIQRRAKRFVRALRLAARPVYKATVAGYVRFVRRPVKAARTSISAIAADCPKAFALIKKTKLEAGVLGAADATVYCLSRAVVKHRSFVLSAVNCGLPVLCVAVLLLTASAVFNSSYALAVQYNGVTVGRIQDETTYNEATELVSQRVISSSEEFLKALTPSYSLVKSNGSDFNSADEICNNILLNTGDVEDAYGFFVNDKLIAAVKSSGDLDFMLEEFLERYRTGAANETVSFVGDTKIIGGLYSNEKIVSSERFKHAISESEMQSQIYTVKSSDSLSKILNRYSMSEERFMQLNSGFDGTLKTGGTVLVEKEQPVLRVKSVIVSSYEKTIAYSTETINDPTQYTTYRKLKTSGKNGLENITQEITYIDGVQVSKDIISRETLIEPVNEVYVVGTKRTTTTKYSNNGGSFAYTARPNGGVTGSGRFTWPLPGVNTVSSGYGMRWGRLHSGIDISTYKVYGRTIVAADKGTVTLVKNAPNGYGLYLIIDHGNGYQTLYAHCSSISVSAGQTVSKGQAIAKVGSSGRSTGAHLHFEIRVNGTAKNPMNWY